MRQKDQCDQNPDVHKECGCKEAMHPDKINVMRHYPIVCQRGQEVKEEEEGAKKAVTWEARTTRVRVAVRYQFLKGLAACLPGDRQQQLFHDTPPAPRRNLRDTDLVQPLKRQLSREADMKCITRDSVLEARALR